MIDRRGVIRRKHVGAVTEAVFREWVEPLLGESGHGGARDVQQAADRSPAAGRRTAIPRGMAGGALALVPAADDAGRWTGSLDERAARLLAVWLLILAPSIGAGRPALAATVSEEEVHAIATQLRCVVCQNLSVADSPSEMARQMRDLIRERLAAGDRPEQVMAYFVQRYGDWVLLAPPARGLNLLLWLAPFGAVVAGLALVVTLARRWRRRPASPEPAAAPAVGPAERERLAAELERLGD